MLNVDEFTHECRAIRVARKLKAIDVIDVLSDLFILRGVPAHIRSDNGPEFVAKAVQEWIAAVGAKTAYIERGARHRELATPLQHDQAPRLHRIQATSTRGVRACIRRVAGCATPTSSAGHAGATANLKLTFHLDHSAGADHFHLFAGPPCANCWLRTSPTVASCAMMARRSQSAMAI
jgi:hypothetical protein